MNDPLKAAMEFMTERKTAVIGSTQGATVGDAGFGDLRELALGTQLDPEALWTAATKFSHGAIDAIADGMDPWEVLNGLFLDALLTGFITHQIQKEVGA